MTQTAAEHSAEIRRSYFRWPQRRDPRWVMIGIHTTFNILGQTVLNFAILPSQIACAVLCCSGWDMLFHRTFYGKWIIPKSGLITQADLLALARLHLVNADGSAFVPTSTSSVSLSERSGRSARIMPAASAPT